MRRGSEVKHERVETAVRLLRRRLMRSQRERNEARTTRGGVSFGKRCETVAGPIAIEPVPPV